MLHRIVRITVRQSNAVCDTQSEVAADVRKFDHLPLITSAGNAEYRAEQLRGQCVKRRA